MFKKQSTASAGNLNFDDFGFLNFSVLQRHFEDLKSNAGSSAGILNVDDLRFLKFSGLRKQLGNQEFQKQSALKYWLMES